MDDGTEATGGRNSSNILSDCCESIIAALYLDGGLSAAKKFIGVHWGSILKETTEPPKDAKTSLQEWAQRAGLPLPKYREVSKTGPAHAPLFMIEVAVEGRNPIMSSGYSKQKAEQLAAQLLLKESCTVTIAHSRTKNIEEICKKADIVIAAVGRPKMVKGNWIKKDAVVIDVGINRITTEVEGEAKNKLVGDVDFNEASKNASAITPVPGGVGPMTIACLLRNTTIAFKNKNKN